MKETDAKAKIMAQGYNIKKFKVRQLPRNLWHLAEIYFDTKTLDIVKAEIEK